jgi:DNA topoisomerase-3
MGALISCPACGAGPLASATVPAGHREGGREYLHCPACGYRRWPPATIEPLPGHGQTCPACGKGALLTRDVTTPDGRRARLLGCDRYPDCRHGEWPNGEA